MGSPGPKLRGFDKCISLVQEARLANSVDSSVAPDSVDASIDGEAETTDMDSEDEISF